ncbi:MAG: hypothetical protein HZA46_18570 [Planctomycetales bacterium]|nr:hypothetical protein [Planctomycetales bacterium]
MAALLRVVELEVTTVSLGRRNSTPRIGGSSKKIIGTAEMWLSDSWKFDFFRFEKL